LGQNDARLVRKSRHEMHPWQFLSMQATHRLAIDGDAFSRLQALLDKPLA
jgi:hypothetical protein